MKNMKSALALVLATTVFAQPSFASLRCGELRPQMVLGGAAGATVAMGARMVTLHKAKKFIRANTINLFENTRQASVIGMRGQSGDKIIAEVALSEEKSKELFLKQMRSKRAWNTAGALLSAVASGVNAGATINNALDGNSKNNGEMFITGANAYLQHEMAKDSAASAADADAVIKSVELGTKKAPQQYIKRIMRYSTPEKAQAWLQKISTEGRISEFTKLPVRAATGAGVAKGFGITMGLATATLVILAVEELTVAKISSELEQKLLAELCEVEDEGGY